jgi:class 3 adenylate cyclase
MSGVSLPRGTVTFLFSDIEESTDLVRRVGDDVFAVMRSGHRRLLRDSFAARGGREIDTAGDGSFVAFDSARSAVAAAVRAQVALAGFTWPADAVSMVVHSRNWSGDPRRPDAGTALFRLVRLAEVVKPGQVLVSQATASLLEGDCRAAEFGEGAIPDFGEPMRVYELLTSP